MPIFSPTIKRMRTRGNIEGLIKAMGSRRLATHFKACEALAETGPTAAKPLITALKNPRKYIRDGAAQALGEIGDQRAVMPLIEALKDESDLVRVHTAGALGKLGDPRAIQALTEALGDPDWSVRQTAAKSLADLVATSFASQTAEISESVRQALRALVAFLNRKTNWLSKTNKETISTKLQGELRSALGYRSAEARTEAARYLGLLGDKSALPMLASMESDESPAVRDAAMHAKIALGWQPEWEPAGPGICKVTRRWPDTGRVEWAITEHTWGEWQTDPEEPCRQFRRCRQHQCEAETERWDHQWTLAYTDEGLNQNICSVCGRGGRPWSDDEAWCSDD